MKLSLITLSFNFLVLAEAASTQQQLKRARGESDGDAKAITKNELPSSGRRRMGNGRSVLKFARRGVSLDVVNARLSTSSSVPLLGDVDVQPARAMAAAPSVTTTTVTAEVVPTNHHHQQQPTVQESFSTYSESNDVEPKGVDTSIYTSQTSTPTSTASASTTTQTAPIVYNKINLTLAVMPYEQIMCENTTKVQSGSVINATWLSRGKYMNSVYLRYGTDDYQTWNSPVGGSLPSFAGQKIGRGDEDIQDPDDTYRMTFQTQIFAWQKGLKLSIVILNQQKGAPIVTFESPQLSIEARCVVEDKKPLKQDSEDDAGNSNKPEEEASEGQDGVDNGSNAKKVDTTRAGNLTSELTNPRAEGAMLGMVHTTSILDTTPIRSSTPTSSSVSRSSTSISDSASGSRPRPVKGSSKHSFVIFISVWSLLFF